MSELYKQQELVNKSERQLKDEQETYNKLIEKRNELETLIRHQSENVAAKMKNLRLHTDQLEIMKANPETKALDKYSFKCESCGKIHKESIYCIAQRASGQSIKHTCDNCGHNTYLAPYKV